MLGMAPSLISKVEEAHRHEQAMMLARKSVLLFIDVLIFLLR